MKRSPAPAALLFVLAALAATVATYWPGLAGPFLLDDYDAIVPLAAAQAQGATWGDLLAHAPSATRARVLANLSFLASNALAGTPMPPEAFGFKLGNLLIHLACALAVWLLARRVALLAGETPRKAAWIAAIAAALFALHPLLVSTVLYAVQRMAQLSTLFVLLAAHAYLAWRSHYARASTAEHVVGIAAILGYTGLALAAKESGALAPVLILVLELCLFRWPRRDEPTRSRFDTGFGLACAAPIVLGLIYLAVRWPRFLAGYARRDFTLGERLLTEVHVVGGYAGQIALPRPSGMGLLLDDIAIRSTPDAATLALLAAFVAAIAISFALRRRWPLLAAAVLWFFGAHLLESTVVSLELAFEHRNYLALFGPVLGAAFLATRLPLRAAVPLAAAAALALGAMTWQRAQDWRSYATWAASEAANHPGSLRAGTELMLSHVRANRLPEAAAERERIAAALPDHAQPVMLKLAFACRSPLGLRLFTSEELQQLRNGRLGKDAVHVYAGLRDLAARRCGDELDRGAFVVATEALAGNRGSRSNARIRASWWRFAVAARLRTDDWSGVAAALRQALREEDNDPRDWVLLAEAAARLGDRSGYLAARQRFLALMRGQPGPLAEGLARADAAAASMAPAPSE